MRPLLPLLPAGQQSIHGATHYPCVSRCWAPGSLVDERYPMFHQRKYPLITIPYPHQCRWFSPEVKSVLIETVWDSLRMFKGKLRGLADWPQSLGWFWWHCSDIFWLFFSLEKKHWNPLLQCQASYSLASVPDARSSAVLYPRWCRYFV